MIARNRTAHGEPEFCKLRHDSQGNALVVTLLITLALTGLVLGAVLSIQSETRLSSNHSMEEKAFYLAERGIEESIAGLAQMGEPLMGSGLDASGPVQLVENKEAGEGSFSVWADPLDKVEYSENSANNYVAITARATLDGAGVSKALRVKLVCRSFAMFAYFTNLEHNNYGSDIWFNDWDELWGPVHSNDLLHIDGSPIFHDVVSSCASEVDYYHDGPPIDNPVFEKGLELDADYIPLPEDAHTLREIAQAPEGLYIANDASIELFVGPGEVGMMRVSVHGGPEVEYDLPANGVVFVEGPAEVWGVLKGQLTIACSGDLSIMDDTVYYTDPRQDPTSTDVLGLISESDIELDASPQGPNVDAGDETIMAAVMALKWSFKGENSNSGTLRGTIHLYGALVQDKRGPFGTYLPSGGIKTGWEEDFRWDARLAKTPPPSFPTTAEIYKVSWEEVDPSSDISANVW